MPDRADFLSSHLLARLASLEAVLREEGRHSARDATQERMRLVEKILAVESGVTDAGSVTRLVNALPTFVPGSGFTDQERRQLAAFLRESLPQAVETETR